jgi:hypothetical protein
VTNVICGGNSWKKIPGAQLDPVVESPLDQSMDSDNLSSQEAAISSKNGAADVPHTSTVRIIELPSSPVSNAAARIRSSVPTIPTPEQPQPNVQVLGFKLKEDPRSVFWRKPNNLQWRRILKVMFQSMLILFLFFRMMLFLIRL